MKYCVAKLQCNVIQSLERNEVLIHARTWANLKKNYAKSKKMVMKDHTLYGSIYMKYLEWANLCRQSRLVDAVY